MAIQALNIAVTGAEAAQIKINAATHDLTNEKSIAFKPTMVETADLPSTFLKRGGIIDNDAATRRPVGIHIGSGVKVTGTVRNTAQGPLNQTNQPLDIAITGHGYFAITLPNGRTGYTRAGNFKRDPENGLVVTHTGNPLSNGVAIPENIDTNDVNISADGRITAPNPEDPTQIIEIGQLEIFTFPNERGLEPIADNGFQETSASGEAIQIGDTNNRFQQKYLEGSTVSLVMTLVEMADAKRQYELAIKAINMVREMEKSLSEA